MSAKIVTVFNQKGGAGKTSLAMLLAGTLGLRGKSRVEVIDMDIQGTAVRWASLAPDDAPFPAAVVSLAQMGGRMHREVRNHIDNFDYIIIDCPPNIESPVPSSAMLISDLVLIPTVLAPADLWAVVGAKMLAQTAMDQNETLKLRIVPNMVQRKTSMAQAALAQLALDTAAPLSKSSLALRTIYREAQALGSPVQWMPRSGDATEEIESLATEVLALLK